MKNFNKAKYFQFLFIILLSVQVIGVVYFYTLAPVPRFSYIINLSDVNLYNSPNIYTKLPNREDIKDFF
ncbi:hypothetical protein J7K70_02905, partial [bacterium]|nr:hypothetical protein [bacterium]